MELIKSMSGEEFCSCFYIPHPTQDRSYTCKLCPSGSKARRSDRGYSNLKPHVLSNHLADVQTVVDSYRNNKINNTLNNYACFVGPRMSPQGTQLFSWLEYCLLEDAPLSIVNKPMTRKYFSIKPCCEKTLRKNFLRVGYLTALNIKADLPPKFGLIFDGMLSNLSGMILTNYDIAYYRMDCSLCQRTIRSHIFDIYEGWSCKVSYGGMFPNG